ncbi:hypothetical protein FQA39_LY01968 [Lamprigera yunnana]|nr:hypothetical protein FQA39_LY01968 [Lamprigera yunnana]
MASLREFEDNFDLEDSCSECEAEQTLSKSDFNVVKEMKMLLGKLAKKKILKTAKYQLLNEENRDYQMKHKNMQKIMPSYYNRNKRPLTSISALEPVLVQKSTRNWTPGEVIKVDKSPESYIIKTQDGNVYRRKRIQLRRFHNAATSYLLRIPPVEPTQSENGRDTQEEIGRVEEMEISSPLLQLTVQGSPQPPSTQTKIMSHT